MTDFRSRPDTGEAYPISGGDSELDAAIDRVMKPIDLTICTKCGSGFGSMTMVSPTEYLCDSCLLREMELMGLDISELTPESVQVSRGRGSPSCTKCGHVYAEGENHEAHWATHPD